MTTKAFSTNVSELFRIIAKGENSIRTGTYGDSNKPYLGFTAVALNGKDDEAPVYISVTLWGNLAEKLIPYATPEFLHAKLVFLRGELNTSMAPGTDGTMYLNSKISISYWKDFTLLEYVKTPSKESGAAPASIYEVEPPPALLADF